MINRLLPIVLMFCASCSAADVAVPPDWIEVSANRTFTLHAPRGTQFHALQGEDSFVGEFVHPDFRIQFDYGMYSNDLSDMRRQPRYQQEQTSVDGRAAVIVWGPGEGDMTWGCKGHLAAMYVGAVDARQAIRLEIHGCAQDANVLPVLIKVLKTTRFLRAAAP